VPDTVVTPPTDQAHALGTVESESTIRDDLELVDLLMDLPELIGKGFSDEEIARRLELADPLAVGYYRSRLDDFRSL
jgi:hypothetical protein